MAAIILLSVLTGNAFQAGMTTPATLDTVMLYLITAIITLITVVLSINQLVLSYQIGPLEKQQDAVKDILEQRDRIATVSNQPYVSMKPTLLIEQFLDGVDRHIDDAIRALSAAESKSAKDAVDQLQEMQGQIPDARKQLQRATFQSTDFIAILADLDITERLAAVRQAQRTISTELEEEKTAIDDMTDVLEDLFVTGEYFKIGYLQTQFIEFSQTLLFLGLPALLFTMLAALLYEPGMFQGTTLFVQDQAWVTAVVFAVSISPFVFLIVYMSRLVTLSKTTIFSGPLKRGKEKQAFYHGES